MPPDKPPQTTPPAAGEAFLVVGLGASAGGIVALRQFFEHVPADTGAAYVVVLHLSPRHESQLAEVLGSVARLPVERVAASTPIKPDHVYVISPNTSLRIDGGMLLVDEVQQLEERRAPVDVFFRALADSHGRHAAVVVLSGTGPNGSNGLKRVKEHGGIAIAQDPGEAEHQDMPRNAIATGLVDFVLPAAEIPARLMSYQAQLSRVAPAVITEPPPDAATDALREILALLRARTGHDFLHYKTPTVLRRIERRQNLHGLPDIVGYARFLREHMEEPVALLAELLISVTNFFRDRDAFAALERAIIPRLFFGKAAMDHVRVWVVGCATGEEAYSVAMLLVEAAERSPDQPLVHVFATDLDEQAIADARDGFYTEADVADLSAERLRRFFTREPEGYRVKRELREMVLFASHNVLKDPPFSHLDLVCCRNLLIYLNRQAQGRLLETFHFSLKPGGFLFLGAAESIEGVGELFAPVEKTGHIYESRPMTGRSLPPLPDNRLSPATPILRQQERRRANAMERVAPADLHLRLLEQYAPPSIVVTENYEIVHMSESAGQYLHVPGGEVSRDLLRLAHPDIRTELRTALYQAARARTVIEVRDIAVTVAGEARRLTITVRPVLRESDPVRGFFLVLLDDRERRAPEEAPQAIRTDLEDVDAVRHLEEELARAKSQLRTTVEQYETQVEEGRASNEELQAVNEELRSAAEELETSKEELQSVNEELTTVNQELKIKIEELALTNNDFRNLINSTDIGTIFLDRTLRVKLSTPRARDVFNLLPHDIGRPLSDITSHVEYQPLLDDARRVLDRLEIAEREVQTSDGRYLLTRVLPYRTTDDRIDGVVMTFQDVTPRRRAEAQVRANAERLRLLIDSLKDYAIFTLTADGKVDSWNAGARRMFGYEDSEIISQDVALLFTPEDRAAGIPAQELQRARDAGRAEDERWHLRRDGSRLYCSGMTTLLGESESRGFAKIARDLTEARAAALELVRAREELEDRVESRTRELRKEVAEHALAQAQVTDLVRRLVTAQEDERRRVARDIHDHVGQQLTALRLSLERHESTCQGTTARREVEAALELARAIDRAIDFLVWELRPAALDDIGLVPALSRYIEGWAQHYRVAAHFRSSGFSDQRLPSDTETTFYRIAQEALNNVAKHARASRVDVIIERRDGDVTLVIEDDGVGFDPQEARPAEEGLGLVGMRERAAVLGASLQVESALGQGTAVFVRASGEAARLS